MRLLLIEDDIKIANFIKSGLKSEGFAVDCVDNGEDGLHLALTEPYDLAIIDLMLPKIEGLTIIEKMRQNNLNTPIIILSAKRSVDDRVRGLKIGSDDYLIKPFAFSELLGSSKATDPSRLAYSDLTMDLYSHKVVRGDAEIDLQPLEFSLLEYLMRNAERVVSRTMIMEHVWDYNFDPQANVVEARICYLRDKIDKNHDKKLIHTVRGVGYVLRENNQA
jgi:two-component system OmpR family response regulator